MQKFRKNAQAVEKAWRRGALMASLKGLWLRRHFEGRYVMWAGGLPAPRVVNRGGRLVSGGFTVFPGVRFEVERGAELRIGKGTYLNRNTTVVCHERVEIGRDCAISWDVVVTDTDQHSWPGIPGPVSAPVIIEDNVWVGCRAIILKGVRIGAGSVVAAGSVVTRDVPPRTLVAGQPARVVRALDPAERRAEQPGATATGSSPASRAAHGNSQRRLVH